MQFGRTARDVQLCDLRVPFQELEALGHPFRRQHLAARRRGIHVAVSADLVAQLGDVDLQRVDRHRRQVDAARAPQPHEVVLRRRRSKL